MLDYKNTQLQGFLKPKKVTQAAMERIIQGFSKLSKSEKLDWLADQFSKQPEMTKELLRHFWHRDAKLQKVLDGFSENTISNYFMPYGLAPNFMVNGKAYGVPMVIEESSVVAAASSAAKFWLGRGGFKAEILGTEKVGQVHFYWKGDSVLLQSLFPELKEVLYNNVRDLTHNMERRGGGIREIKLLDYTDLDDNYYQLQVLFETCDSMGANFINSVLETFATTLKDFLHQCAKVPSKDRNVEVLMAILSNYTPNCLVRASVECPIEVLSCNYKGQDSQKFAERFFKAVKIAQIDPFRATTHNKGIFNGVDAVVLATGNDFRAVEACGHAYASRSGQYRSLTNCSIEKGHFKFWLDLPLAVGTVGGLTNLHPLARLSLELLGNPSAEELMMIIAATGLAQNFAAVRSLVTTGIQQGHMKMHLKNILIHLNAQEDEIKKADAYFKDKTVSFNAVRTYLDEIRIVTGKSPQKI